MVVSCQGSRANLAPFRARSNRPRQFGACYATRRVASGPESIWASQNNLICKAFATVSKCCGPVPFGKGSLYNFKTQFAPRLRRNLQKVAIVPRRSDSELSFDMSMFTAEVFTGRPKPRAFFLSRVALTIGKNLLPGFICLRK